MFIGHFALGYAAKRAAPKLSLALLFAAAQFADILWPVLVALGVERVIIAPGNTAFTPLDFVSYPYSHSLMLLIVWGALFGLLFRSSVIAALVISHWLLDWITHRPDMPTFPMGPKIGLGLWNSVPATLIIETAMFAIGVAIYLQSTRARDGVGRWATIGLIAFLLIVYYANAFGPPPPSVTALWITAMIGFVLMIAWAWWADRHRTMSPR